MNSITHIKILLNYKAWLLFAVFLITSCNQKPETSNQQPATDTSATPLFIKINPDSLTIITPGLNGIPLPQVVSAEQPKVIPTYTNIHIAGKPEIILAGTPRIITPGTDTFPLPKTIIINPDSLISVTAGIPEVVIAKDAYIKDNNPQNFSSFSKLQGLRHDVIGCMLQDQSGNLWFGTSGGGVSKYDGKSFTNFTEKEGLSNNFVFSILQDQSGNLWFGTRFGLCKLPVKGKAKLVDFFDKCKLSGQEKQCKIPDNEVYFKTYGYEDGFLGIGVNGGNNGKNVYEAKDGTIWIAANDRLTAYHPEGYVPDTIPPNIQLTSIELFSENIAWTNLNLQGLSGPAGGDPEGFSVAKDTILTLGNGVKVGDFEFDGITRWYGLPENLSLAYNNNYLTFNFIGITQSQPKKVKYQYKLEGIDENWSAITNRTSAPYGNLPHGNYTFRLKAMNSEGYWSNEFTYSFTIRPPWWLTWWFRTIYITASVLALFGIYRWRTAAMRRRQKQLVAEVRRATIEIREKNEELNQQNEEITTQRDEITAQRDLVTEQKQELEKLSIVASETENAVIIMDAEGMFEWVNRGFERLYGFTLEQFTAQHGKTIYETSSNPDFKKVVHEAVANNRSITYNSQFTKETGETVWMQTTLTPIFADDGSLKKLVAIESDITKIKEAEEEIRQQKEKIEEIHKEVTDSINYAKRIQTSALPDLKQAQKHLSDIFVLFKPKDVVSGDFYWFAEVENKIVITVADCTGHGVPGAFMSMLGMSLLKEIVVKEYMTQPDIILKRLRKEIIKALGQTGASGEQKDGMDMSLCTINTETLEMQWAGANNPIYLVTGYWSLVTGEANQQPETSNQKLIELKPDKMPIAIHDRMDKFTLHEMKLNKGDIIYLAGDGYQDQFGGSNGKKFMSKRFKEMLLEISSKPMKEQHDILEKTINDWMFSHETKYEQTDDITVMGIKI